MSSVIVGDDQRESWNSFVHRSETTISWHVYDWFNVERSFYRVVCYPIAAFDGHDICGVLPLYRVRTLRLGTALVSIPYVVAGGIAADDVRAQAVLLERAIDLARELGDVPLVLKQYKYKIAGDLSCDEGFYNREISLSSGWQPVWDGLHELNKQQITAAQREDLVLECPAADFEMFYRLLLRHQHLLGVPCPSKRWVRGLVETGMYTIAFLRRGSELLAATLVKRFKKTVSYPLTCLASPNDPSQCYAYALYWFLIERAVEDGIEIVHSGRIPNNEMVPKYRLGWGGQECRYFYQYLNFKRRTESTSKSGNRRKYFGNAWRIMPRRAVEWIGPRIIAQFP